MKKWRPQPDTHIAIELNIPKPRAVRRMDSTGEPRRLPLRGTFKPHLLNRPSPFATLVGHAVQCRYV